jgi:hypothetical protein
MPFYPEIPSLLMTAYDPRKSEGMLFFVNRILIPTMREQLDDALHIASYETKAAAYALRNGLTIEEVNANHHSQVMGALFFDLRNAVRDGQTVLLVRPNHTVEVRDKALKSFPRDYHRIVVEQVDRKGRSMCAQQVVPTEAFDKIWQVQIDLADPSDRNYNFIKGGEEIDGEPNSEEDEA